MNKRQMNVLWAGIITFIFLGLFPPMEPRGFGFLLFLEWPVLFCELIIEWLILSVGAAGLIYYLRGQKPMTGNQCIVIVVAILLLITLFLTAIASELL